VYDTDAEIIRSNLHISFRNSDNGYSIMPENFGGAGDERQEDVSNRNREAYFPDFP
jgi:hypothetical protein